MNKKLKAYRTLVLADDKALHMFLKSPVSELQKHAGKVITAKQGTAIKNLFAAGKKAVGAFPEKAGKVGRAPRWVHRLVDFLWDLF
jgi:hypothetical protein